MEKKTNPKDALGIRKVPIHTVPMHVLSEVGLAMLEGGRKYGSHNYRDAGVKASVYIDAVWRHLFLQWWEGENIDTDSGLSHITKAIASLVVLRDSMIMDNMVDDRPIRHPDKAVNKTEYMNTLAGEIIDRIPDCKTPFTEKNKCEAVPEYITETKPGYGGKSPRKLCSDCANMLRPTDSASCKGCFATDDHKNWEPKK